MASLAELLADPASEKRFLVALYPYDPVARQQVTVLYSTHGYVTLPAATLPGVYAEARVKAVPDFGRSLFSEGRLSGHSANSEGSIVLANDDGGLDYLANYAWAGRAVEIYIGGGSDPAGVYYYIMRLYARELAYGEDGITVNLRDLSLYLDKEVQTVTFAGTGGIEGTADLKGRRKPEAWGLCRHVPAVYLGVDGGRHRFSVGSGPIVGVLAVFDRGAPLAYAAAPVAGQWSVDLATGTITLGGAFNGPIGVHVIGRRTCSVASSTSQTVETGAKTFAVATGGSSPEAQIAAGMRVRCLSASDPAGTYMDGYVTGPRPGGTLTVQVDSGRAGSASAANWIICPFGTAAGVLCDVATKMGLGFNVADASRQDLNATQPATIGYWVPEGGNAQQILDAVADGACCCWGVGYADNFYVGRVGLPAASPAVAVGADQILTLERVSTDEPAYRANIRYCRNWQVLSGDQLAGVADADKTFFTQEWRQSGAGNDATQAAYPTSKIIEIDSVFDLEADAYAECVRQGDLFGVRRDYFRVTTKVAPLTTPLNQTVLLTFPRYGLTGGKSMRAIDVAQNLDDLQVVFGLWG